MQLMAYRTISEIYGNK